MEMEQVRTEPAVDQGVEPAVEQGVEPDADRDRDRIALEALEGELAVLEDELARVDADRSDPTPGGHR